MKFVESAEFESISSYLCFNTPDCRVAGNLDLFTTKPATSDRKLIRELDRQLELKADIECDVSIEDEEEDVVEFVDTKLDEMKIGSLQSRKSIGESQSESQSQSQSQSQSVSVPANSNSNSNSANASNTVSSAASIKSTSSTNLPLSLTKNVSFAGSLGSNSGSNSDGHPLSPPASYGKRRAYSATLPYSPFGPLDQGQSRKQYAYLIAVLNAGDPDRDYSSLQPEQFCREFNFGKVINSFNTMMLGLGSPPPPGMWDAIDRQVDLKDCRIYSLVLPPNFMQDEPGVVWWKMWFFFNKRRKRVIFLQLRTYRDEKEDEDAILGELE